MAPRCLEKVAMPGSESIFGKMLPKPIGLDDRLSIESRRGEFPPASELFPIAGEAPIGPSAAIQVNQYMKEDMHRRNYLDYENPSGHVQLVGC